MSPKFDRLQFSGKPLLLPKAHNPKREKWGPHFLSRPEFWMVWRRHGILSFHFYLFFCLEATLAKDTWMTATSATAMVIFSKVPFRNLIDHSYVKVSSQKLGSTLKTDQGHPTIKDLWTWIKMRASSLIKTLVNIMKRKSTKMPWKLLLAKKNAILHLKEHCIKRDGIWLLLYTSFSLKKTSFLI